MTYVRLNFLLGAWKDHDHIRGDQNPWQELQLAFVPPQPPLNLHDPIRYAMLRLCQSVPGRAAGVADRARKLEAHAWMTVIAMRERFGKPDRRVRAKHDRRSPQGRRRPLRLRGGRVQSRTQADRLGKRPVHSGGAADDDFLVGVCNSSDVEKGTGSDASPRIIHAILDKNGLVLVVRGCRSEDQHDPLELTSHSGGSALVHRPRGSVPRNPRHRLRREPSRPVRTPKPQYSWSTTVRLRSA